MYNDLRQFLDSSPSCFHAAENLSARLTEAGFTELDEGNEWNVKPGGAYFVRRNMSAIIAFRIPASIPNGIMLCAAHSDSPTFKVKYGGEMQSKGYVRLNTERYGGMIYSSWLDRPLSLAGRVVLSTADGIEVRLVNVDRDLMIIPNVAIHMNRSVNDGYAYNPAVDLVPLLASQDGRGDMLQAVAESAGIDRDSIADYDLFVYNRQKSTLWGHEYEFISASKIDDLQCAYCAVEAIIAAESCPALAVAAVFDNEEVGSLSKQGADSTFLADVAERVCNALYGVGSLNRLLANGLMLSADNAHAVHPNHPEYADPDNRPVMNGGVVIKYSANQKYTSDAVSAALFERICKNAGVPVQRFTNRSDMLGGSTLGNISNSHLSLPTVDIGCAQLAMHSAYETAGARDTELMTQAMTEFFKTALLRNGKEITVK